MQENVSNPVDPRTNPIGFATGFWSALVLVTNSLNVGFQISVEVAGAVGILIPFVVVGVRALLGKSTAIK